MPLTDGTRIGAYAVTGSLGAGGMGEVYRAHDTKLDRDVALKVLPAAVAADPDRLARFEREARVLASLNHPHIAQIHGIEETDGAPALVLELVDGETLAERLARGPIPLADALSIARQIAAALQSAHEAGIVHRDLKPANVKIRTDGAVKVLDFGLAKALDAAPAPDAAGQDPLASPTLTASATRMGVILGTPAYMSPEQAAGQAVDARSDLWSFGVVLCEMLTGERLFAGETVPQVLARVIDREPDLTALPPATPAPVRRLLGRCLERDPRRRMRDAGEAISDLEAAAGAPGGAAGAGADAPETPGAPPPGWRARVARAGGGAAIAALLAAMALGGLIAAAVLESGAASAGPPVVRRLTLPLPVEAVRGSAIALSPDGAALVYAGRTGGVRHLLVRRLDQPEAQPIAGTEGAFDPFLSPDGAWVGFFAAPASSGPTERFQNLWTLKKVPLQGGTPITLADGLLALGASWGDDDRIVLGDSGNLLRVPAAGGAPEVVLSQPAGLACIAPHVLPGSDAVLFMMPTPPDTQALMAASLISDTQRPVAEGFRGTYTPTGHLVFLQRPGRSGSAGARTGAATLLAAPFDLDRLEPTGAPIALVEGIDAMAWSADGTLVYAAAAFDDAPADRALVWVDRDGREEPVPAPPLAYSSPRLSPDGDRAALVVPSAGGSDIVIYDVARRVSNRLTFEAEVNSNPLWSPDGEQVIFLASGRDTAPGLFRKRADGAGQAERLTTSIAMPYAWTPDEETIIGWHLGGRGAQMRRPGRLQPDIHLLPLHGDAPPAPLIATAANEVYAAISPDGRWLAYASDESGNWEVYVRPFPNIDDGRWQVSQGGGISPVWSAAGRELFFRSVRDDGVNVMMAAAYAGEPTFTPSRPEPLFEAPYRAAAFDRMRPWDVTPAGDRFLMIRESMPPADRRRGPTELAFVGNWLAELAARVPVP